MSILTVLAELTRPTRRRLHSSRFKETYINQALKLIEGETYVEIGVRNGESFRAVHASRKIGVDPTITSGMSKLRSGEELYVQTSDDFFNETASTVLETNSIDVALIDGLHVYQQALRDLLNLERYMNPAGVVVMDDLNPRSSELATPRPMEGVPWNGDVWKVAAFLRSERPDLTLITLDADQGVGLVTGFNSNAGTPSAQTIQRYEDLDYSYLEENRRQLLGLRAPESLNTLFRGHLKGH